MPQCKHTHIEYLGEQETPVEGVYLKLYICIECHTTIIYTPETSPEIVAAPAH